MASLARLVGRSIWTQGPPTLESLEDNQPTLLFSYWATASAAAIIISRLIGRKMRSGKLFAEDWIMAFALVPLIIRQILIHLVLIYGTNDVQLRGTHFTPTEIADRSTGSRLVLAARIFYSMFIWFSKLTVSEFLKRITVLTWRRSYQLTLQAIRIFLFVSFGAVVIATLTECQPFDHFWQVVPDPGPSCRNGYAHLISMGACDIFTDILLIVFPIPIVLRSGQTWNRKIQLGGLFSLSIIMIAVTATRVPEVIAHHGRQQYRTVWASAEILASAAVSNAVILASFLRDKGTRRNRYRSSSVGDCSDSPPARKMSSCNQTSSEEDLFRSLGMRIPSHLEDKTEAAPRPAPTAQEIDSQPKRCADAHRDPAQLAQTAPDDRTPHLRPPPAESSDSDDSMVKPQEDLFRVPTPMTLPPQSPPAIPNVSPRRISRAVSFFDVGGLLHNGNEHRRPAQRSPPPRNRVRPQSGVVVQDFASNRRNSRMLLQDVSGLLGPPSTTTQQSNQNPSNNHSHSHHFRDRYHIPFAHLGHRHHHHHNSNTQSSNSNRPSGRMERHGSHSSIHFSTHGPTRVHHNTRPPPPQPMPAGVLGPMLSRHDTQYSLQDAGGLLITDMVRARAAASRPAPRMTEVRSHDGRALSLTPQPPPMRPSLHGAQSLPEDETLPHMGFLPDDRNLPRIGLLPDDDALPHIGVLPPASSDDDTETETETQAKAEDEDGERDADIFGPAYSNHHDGNDSSPGDADYDDAHSPMSLGPSD